MGREKDHRGQKWESIMQLFNSMIITPSPAMQQDSKLRILAASKQRARLSSRTILEIYIIYHYGLQPKIV
jgi:hypothetical protein